MRRLQRWMAGMVTGMVCTGYALEQAMALEEKTMDGSPETEIYPLWSGAPVPSSPTKVPFAEGMEHRTIHRASADGYKFLHGAAIINYKGTFFANWANSPKNENYPDETLQGRRATDPQHARGFGRSAR